MAERRFGAARLFAVLLLAGLALVPLLASLAGQPFYVTLFTRILIFALAAIGLNLILGFGAMVSFGHAMYIGIGAYAVGILSYHGIDSGWVHLRRALGVGAVVALGVGAICLRTSGMAFIMITLAFAQMLFFLAVSLREYGGDDGMQLKGRSVFGALDLNNDGAVLPGLRAAAGGAVRLLAAGAFALRHGAARLPQQRAAHGLAGFPDAALPAQPPT